MSEGPASWGGLLGELGGTAYEAAAVCRVSRRLDEMMDRRPDRTK